MATPRRSLSGAALVFLFVLLARASDAGEQRIVSDQDLRGLSREEQVAYLILIDQFAGIRRWHQMMSQAAGEVVAPREVACVRVGQAGKSIDPSPALLVALNHSEMAGETIQAIPASKCDVDHSRPLIHDPGTGRLATLVETDVLSPNREAYESYMRCPGSKYSGGWLEQFSCAGLCGVGGGFYDVGEDAHSIWLVRSSCP